jgi:5-methylcytosine-specific restriction endonuclease McrA
MKCNYPEGFKRRSRELHVHHIVPRSEGGTDALSNLVTLCHVCHRKNGENHCRVKKLNKAKPRKRRRRSWRPPSS